MTFYSISGFPKVERLAKRFRDNFDSLLNEGVTGLSDGMFSDWPEPINKGGWSILASKWQGSIVAPSLALSQLVGDVAFVNVGYSHMAAGASISPHVGYTKDVLRLHLGLICPDGDCAISVGDQTRRWSVGGFLFFDDTEEHEAWNRTDHGRLIIITDIQRNAID